MAFRQFFSKNKWWLLLFFIILGSLSPFYITFASVQCEDCLDVSPAMTSANTPAPYVVSADDHSSGRDPWEVFDKSLGPLDDWSVTSDLPHWLKLDLGSGGALEYKAFRYYASTDFRFPTDFKIQGSNNDSDWVDLLTITDDYYSFVGGSSRWYGFDTSAEYRYYRLYITAGSNSGNCSYCILLKELQFSTTFSPEPTSFIDPIPAMTSANTPTPYVVSADSYYSGGIDYVGWLAFDNILTEVTHSWLSGIGSPHWAKIDLGSDNAQSFNAFRFLSSDHGVSPSEYCPEDFKIQGSNNDSDWVDLASVVGFSPSSFLEWSPYFFSDTSAEYRYYRFYTTNPNTVNVQEIELKQVQQSGTVDFDIDYPASVFVDNSFNISFNATSTDAVLQLCGLWDPVFQIWQYEPVNFTNTCSFDMDLFSINVGDNDFLAMAQDVNGSVFYSDIFTIEGLDYDNIEPPVSSDIPTMTFTVGNTTTTVGTDIQFYTSGYDDEEVIFLRVWDPQLSDWVVFQNPDVSNELLTAYSWTPDTAGLFTFYAEVYDNDWQVGVPDPFYINIFVSEDLAGGIALPITPAVSSPTKHFLITSAENIVGWLKLPELWKWWTQLFKEKFPFSWLYSIFDVWSEQRDLVSSMASVDPIKVSWTFPDVGFLSGQEFQLFDLQTARDTYSDFFDTIRVILINVLWLTFAFYLFKKVKKFISDMTLND